MGLSNVLLKLLGLQEDKPKVKNSLGEDLTHLDPDGELPWGWLLHNKETIDQIESELAVFRTKIHDAKTDVEKYAALKSYVLYVKEGKKHYREVGECEGKYFDEYICKSQETITNRKRFKEIEAKLLGSKKQ